MDSGIDANLNILLPDADVSEPDTDADSDVSEPDTDADSDVDFLAVDGGNDNSMESKVEILILTQSTLFAWCKCSRSVQIAWYPYKNH